MYYLVDMYDEKLNFIENIDGSSCLKIKETYEEISDLLKYYNLGRCVRDAFDDLIFWNNNVDRNANYLIRNLHTAERFVRGYLFEFRTCLDHMETDIKRKYGKNSELMQIFKKGTSNSYDSCNEYAFTYHLRNYAQHCNTIVHGFNSETGIGLSSNIAILLSDYKEWKQIDKDFMQTKGKHIDLLNTFEKSFNSFNVALKPVIQYFLDKNNGCENLLYLRQWGDSLQNEFKHSISSFHIMKIMYKDGRDATREDMATGDVIINAYPLDWETIYELSNSLVKRKI